MATTVFDPTLYQGQVVHFDTDGTTVLGTIRDRTTGTNYLQQGRFELLRQGGCGSGSFTIAYPFTDSSVRVGQWIGCYYDPTVRWYFGRIESVEADSPRGIRVQTYGPVVLLNDRAIGGFDADDDTRGPHLFSANQDDFSNDPDYSSQEWTQVSDYEELANEIYTQYIQPLGIGLGAIQQPIPQVPMVSFAFRGQESVNQVIRNVAIAANNASWGIDANGNFFFLRNNPALFATYQEGQDLLSLKRTEDRSVMVNRIYVVGDYIYGEDNGGRGPYSRYQKVYFDEPSWTAYGERRLEAYLPWIRTHVDSQKWCEAFFAKYANPIVRYSAQTHRTHIIPYPWGGYFGITDKDGNLLAQDVVESIDVDITNYPSFSFTTGPENLQYMKPPEPERWELAGDLGDLGPITSALSDFTGTAESSDERSSHQTGSSDELLSSGQLLSSDDPLSSDDHGSSGAPESSGVPSSGDSGNLSSHELASSDALLSSDDHGSSGAPISSGVPTSDAPSSHDSYWLSSQDHGSSDAPSSSGVPTSDAPSAGESGSDNESDCGCVQVLKDVTISAECSDGNVVITVTKEYDYVAGCCA